MCFNSRSREGATQRYYDRLSDFIVSIHAPVRERQKPLGWYHEAVCFNSRSREGATMAVKSVSEVLSVSIHAPVRERPRQDEVVIAVEVSIHAPVRERRVLL